MDTPLSLLERAVPSPAADGLASLVDDRYAAETAKWAAWAREALLPVLPAGPATLGPTFAWSPDVGGADGDIAVGGLLLDIKAGAPASRCRDGAQTLSRIDLWQLAGYALLDANDCHGLNDVGFYLARGATLVRWCAGR